MKRGTLGFFLDFHFRGIRENIGCQGGRSTRRTEPTGNRKRGSTMEKGQVEWVLKSMFQSRAPILIPAPVLPVIIASEMDPLIG